MKYTVRSLMEDGTYKFQEFSDIESARRLRDLFQEKYKNSELIIHKK